MEWVWFRVFHKLDCKRLHSSGGKKNDATHLPVIKVSRNSKFDITNLQMAPHAFGVLQDPDLV